VSFLSIAKVTGAAVGWGASSVLAEAVGSALLWALMSVLQLR
jgi:hypothetical protein